METHFGYGRIDRLLNRADGSAEIDADPAVIPFTPAPNILAAIRAGEELTTEAIVARMGLLPSVPLQRRVAAALDELGYRKVRRDRDGHGVKIWVAAPPSPISDTMRRVHQDADRAHGLTPLCPRPGPIARLIAFARSIF